MKRWIALATFVLLLAAGCVPAAKEPAEALFLWKGELTEPPEGPRAGWCYYDPLASTAYYWDGESWATLVVDGSPGIGIVWKGNLASAPANPEINWAYHNSTDNSSYIWDGDSWELLLDGSGASMNVHGSVAHGSYLALAHNLDRGDLTFKAQYLRGGQYHDIDELDDGIPEMVFRNDRTLVTEDNVARMSAARSSAGVIMLAYCDATQSNHGYFVITDDTGAVTAGPTLFANVNVSTSFSVCALTNGSFVIAYRNDSSSGQGFMVVYDATGTVVTTATSFSSGQEVTYVSVAALAGGSFVVGYTVPTGTYPSYFRIYNATGTTELKGETLLDEGRNVQEKVLLPLAGGGFLAAYRIGNSDGQIGLFRIYDSTGTEVTTNQAVLEDCQDAWDEWTQTEVTPTTDSTSGYYKQGGTSARLDVADGAAAGTLATEAVASTDLSGYNNLSFWIRSTVAWSAGQLQVLLDDSAACASPELTYTFQTGIDANTWTKIWIPVTAGTFHSANPVVSVGISQVVDKGAMTLWVDDVRLGKDLFDSDLNTTTYLSAAPLQDGRVLVAYRTSEATGCYAVIDPATGEVDRRRIYAGDDMSYGSVCPLDDGELLIAYEDAGGSDYEGELVLVDSAGYASGQSFLFESNTVTLVTAIPTVDRECFIFYRDGSDTFTYFVRAGAYSLDLQKVDDNQVRLWNYSGRALELSLSLDR